MRAGASSPATMTTAPSRAPRSDRPALQALLAEVRAGKIDIIVVYKVDRLTRSLADFAKLVELFDSAFCFVRVGHPVLQYDQQHGAPHPQTCCSRSLSSSAR